MSIEAINARNQFRGRIKEMYKSGGENVYPPEVEAVIAECPGVALVAVIGVPDPKWGEAITAVVQPRAGTAPDLATLAPFTRERLSAYKAPKHVVTVDRLVRSPAGKADYRWARETALAAVGSH